MDVIEPLPSLTVVPPFAFQFQDTRSAEFSFTAPDVPRVKPSVSKDLTKVDDVPLSVFVFTDVK